MRSKTGYAEFGYFHCYLKRDAPRALVFRPLVKGNEAPGTRLGLTLNWEINCFEITTEQIQELARKSQEYFRANALFLPSSVNPTVWTLGNNVAAHCKEVFQRYGQGLCTVTWRAERQSIALWKQLSSFQRQWYDIFKHEFIMSIWLPEKGFDTFLYKPSKNVYIPSRVFDRTATCYCGLERQTQ